MKVYDYNPAKNLLGQILGKCYEKDITFNELVEECGFSSGTASKDKRDPYGIPVERLILYMTALSMDSIEIKLNN
jgi:hypothetical protein